MAFQTKTKGGMNTKKFQLLAWSILSLSIVFLMVSAVLSFGIIERKLVFTGPFNAESDVLKSQSLIIDLRSDLRWRRLFSTGGDSANNPNASKLRVFVNGLEIKRPHSPHDVIRADGGGGFSHWKNHLIFSLPAGVTNSSLTQLEVHHSLYLEPKLIGVALFATVLGAGLLLRQLYRREQKIYNIYIYSAVLVIGYVLQFGLLLAMLAAIFFNASTIAGWSAGYVLPNTAFFRWWPELNALAINEPFFGHVILCLAMLGCGASWLAISLGPQGQSFAQVELRLTQGFRRYGFFFVAALFLYSVGATWSGIPRPQDLGGNAIAGLLPFNDANGHFQHVYLQAIKGEWEPFVARRPLAAAFRTIAVAAVDYNNFYFLMLQVIALATATFFAVRAVMAWRGLWAGLTFLGLAFIQVRPYLPTNLTEPLGIFWALVSIPFLVRAIRFNRLGDVVSAFHLTVWALMTRMGAMFTLPALGLWAVLSQRGSPNKISQVIFGLISLTLVNIVVVSSLSKLYGTQAGAVASNFSTVICGLTHGVNWTGCGLIYNKELNSLTTESAQASLYYSKAKEKFLNEPSVLFDRLLEGESQFVGGIWTRILTGYTGSIPDLFPTPLWWLAVISGIIWLIRYKCEEHEGFFWLFFLTGLAASAPFVIFDDGWRVLCASLVVVSLLLACGFTSPFQQIFIQSAPYQAKVQKYHVVLLLLVAILCLAVPGLTHKYDRLGMLNYPKIELREDEELFLGMRRMSGFMVIPDGQAFPKHVPAIHESDFISVVRYSGIEQYESLVTPSPIYQPPFAIVSAIPVNQRTHGLLIMPPSVFFALDEKLWRFRLQIGSGQFWVKVLEATPVKELE